MKVTQIYNPNFKDDYTIALNYQQQLKKLGCDSDITDTIDGAMTGLIHVHCPVNALVLGELKIPYIFTIHQYYIDNNIYNFSIIEKSIKSSTISLYYSESLPKSLISNKVFFIDHRSNWESIGEKLLKIYEITSIIKKNYTSEETKNLFIKNYGQLEPKSVTLKLNYIDGCYLELVGNTDYQYRLEIYDDSNKLYYSSMLTTNMWTKLNRKYFMNCYYKLFDGDKLIMSDKLNLENKDVLISFESKSLGDTLAWVPYCEEFRKKHNCNVIVSTFWNHFFEDTYPNLKFVQPGSIVQNVTAMYRLGWFFDKDKEPVTPNLIPLQKSATNILGLDFQEIKPNIKYNILDRPISEKYITIATQSTAGLKYWNNPTGWQEVVNHLTNLGYKVFHVSKEGTDLKNVEQLSDTSIENTINYIHHSEFFIGLSSGLSWLSWAIGKHVVMISNFTTPDHEFVSNCTRIINHDVCNGCWNNPLFKFDKGDWDWCPEFQNTERHFECHKSITPEMVINKIQDLL
jgi:autotransporter strand-loop-strand O-heptosyltransferase